VATQALDKGDKHIKLVSFIPWIHELQDTGLVACDLNATVATKVGMQSVFRHKGANPVFDDLSLQLLWQTGTRRGRCFSIKQHLWMRCAVAVKCGSAFSTL